MNYHSLRGPLFALVLAAPALLPLTAARADEAPRLPAACTAAAKAPAPMQGMGMGMGKAQQPGSDSMMQMHDAMASAATIPDPDLAFNCGMIAHHQGAIAMAETELKAGRDEASLKLAKAIIAAQREEIGAMTAWIEQHAK